MPLSNLNKAHLVQGLTILKKLSDLVEQNQIDLNMESNEYVFFHCFPIILEKTKF